MNRHARTWAEMMADDEEGPGLAPLAALGAVANFAADDWLRAARPDLRVHPMGCYPAVAAAVVLALENEVDTAVDLASGMVRTQEDANRIVRLRDLLAAARSEGRS